jgi:hypothetical protein
MKKTWTPLFDEKEWRGSVGNIIIKQGRLVRIEQMAVSIFVRVAIFLYI